MPANMAMMVMTAKSSTKVKAFTRRSNRNMGGLAPLLRGAAFDVPLVALGSLFGAHFAHCAGEALSCLFCTGRVIHDFLSFFVPLFLRGQGRPLAILANRFFGGLSGIRLFGGRKGTDSGLEPGEESFGRKGGVVSPAESATGCLTGTRRTSRSIPFRASGKEVDEFGLASCVMRKGRNRGENRA